jgi:hypothetical protein
VIVRGVQDVERHTGSCRLPGPIFPTPSFAAGGAPRATARCGIGGGGSPRRRLQHRRPAVLPPTRAARRGRPSATKHLPLAHPPSIARTEISRRPRTDCDVVLATRPVTVKVSTVVVRSGTARRRTTAFWPPIAKASSPINVRRTVATHHSSRSSGTAATAPSPPDGLQMARSPGSAATGARMVCIRTGDACGRRGNM